MSVSDSESGGSNRGSRSNEYKFFRQTCRDRLLYDMLRSTFSESKSWKVLIMDKVTLRVMSSNCKMADITDEGISLVEDLFRRREPMPSMDAIYFIQPSKENLVMFLSDMSGREPLYRKAFVFFCAPAAKELINHIKCDVSVCPRLGALREMNLEFFPVDNQVFVTDHENALEDLYGESAKNSRKFEALMTTLAIRIGTVFASLKELPHVRYQAPRDPDSAPSHELLPSKLASAVWNSLMRYKSTIPNFPQKETCEFLIIDRSVDQIAPVIHEWTYDAMCHDLLELDGNKIVIETTNKSTGKPEPKEVLMEDSDPVWLEIRHCHIAEASEKLHEKMTAFKSKNKAAQLSQASKDGTELSTRDLQKMVQALPQYTEQMEKLSLHVEIAGKINKCIRDMGLRDLGQIEQDIVFGEAGTKELIAYLRANPETTAENKLRLLMIFASAYPDSFEGDKGVKLMQLAKLSNEDIKAIDNMKKLAPLLQTNKKSSAKVSLTFDGQKKKLPAARKDKTNPEEEGWALSKFYPILEEIIESVDKGNLSKSEYQYINEPSGGTKENTSTKRSSGSSATTAGTGGGPRSMRSRRTATWAKPHHSDDGSSDSVLNKAANDLKMIGSRVFIFIIGGATRSELRACHKLTTKLRREIIVGTTSIDDPPQYLKKLKVLTPS